MAWINCINCQIISLLKKVSSSSKSTASILPDLTKTVAQQTQMITQMGESLQQIINLLQIQNQRIGSMTTPAPELPVDCSNVSATDNNGSGVYTIDPKNGSGSFEVFCDMDNGGGGWTIFQKRFDGSVDFFLGWDEYEQGFGNVSGEYWLGLQQVHRLTSSGRWTLRIDMEDFDGNVKYAQYEDFKIGDAASFYQLSYGAFSGTIKKDSLATYHKGQPFSTKDRDHDNCPPPSCLPDSDSSCALHHQGAWWYKRCLEVNLNGRYKGSSNHQTKMCWFNFSGGGCTPIKKSEMKIRRVQ